ncbi:MAG: redoxin domain-containing protein, partial [Mangrovicoccus sp.]
MSAKLIPGQLAPMLECDTLAHGRFDLSAEAPAGGTLVVFHHGVACKWDRRKLKELDDRIGDFAIRGLRLIAISADSREETARLQEEMQLIRLPLAFGLPVAELAAEWGIYTGCDPASASGQLRFEPAQIWVTQSGQ